MLQGPSHPGAPDVDIFNGETCPLVHDTQDTFQHIVNIVSLMMIAASPLRVFIHLFTFTFIYFYLPTPPAPSPARSN